VKSIVSNLGLVSIIVPSYNYGRFLEQFIGNLRDQSYSNWECILVDDGSRDDTERVALRLQATESRLRYLQQENAGPSAARNRGLEECRGEYVQFLDADDFLEARKLEIQAGYLHEHPEVDIVYGNMRYFGEADVGERPMAEWGSPNPWLRYPSGTGDAVLKDLLRVNLSTPNAPLLRRKVLDAAGVFDPAMRQVEDWDFWIRCALSGQRFQYLDRPGSLALARSHEASASRNECAMLASELRMRQRLSNVLPNRQLRHINRAGFAATAAILGVREGFEGKLIRGCGRLYQAAFMTGNLKWLLYALLLPLAVNRWGRLIVRNYRPDLVR